MIGALFNRAKHRHAEEFQHLYCCTGDSGCGEVMCMGAERPKFIWTEGRRCVPAVIAG